MRRFARRGIVRIPATMAYARKLHSATTKVSTKFDGASSGCYDRTAGWSSLVARWAHNPKVGGSNPPPATNAIIELRAIGHLQQLSKTSDKGNCHTVPLIY